MKLGKENRMKVSIKGSPKEIAALALVLREQSMEQIKLKRDVKDLQKYLLSERKEMLDNKGII